MASVFQNRVFVVVTKWKKNDGKTIYAVEGVYANEPKAEATVMSWNAGEHLDEIRINNEKPEGEFLGADLVVAELDDLFHEHKDKDGNDAFPRIELTF